MGVRLALTPWLGVEGHATTLALPLIAAVSFVVGVRWALAMSLAVIAWVSVPMFPPHWPAGWWAGPQAAKGFGTMAAMVAAALSGLLFRAGRAAAVSPSQTSQRLRTTHRALGMSVALAVAVPLALLAVYGHRSQRAVEQLAALGAQAAARTAGEHVARLIQGNEIIARQVDAEVGPLASSADAEVALRLHRVLSSLAQRQPHVNSLWVLGADGYPMGSSLFERPPRINYQDREYFRHHQSRRNELFVSSLLVTRSTRELFFDVSARHETADGSFLGVINVTLRPEYFVDFFGQTIAAQPWLQITLLRDDGSVLARSNGGMASGERLAEGHPLLAAMQQGRAEGSVKVAGDTQAQQDMVFRQLSPYPLYVGVSLDNAAIHRAWMRDVAPLGALALLASCVLLLALWTVWRRTLAELLALDQLADAVEQRRRAEESLRQSQKLEALGQLTTSVAHDFNNVLGVAQNHLALLAHTNPELSASRPIAGLQRAVKSGEHLTRKLLAFSRRQALRPEVIDLASALPAMLDLMRITLGSTISLQLEVESGTPAIKVDRAELELALLNLATNARAAIGGTGEVRVSARAVAVHEVPPDVAALPSPPSVLISVADNGRGMDASTSQRAFEPFFTTKGEGQGTGLGLAQVCNLCEQAGGAARIDSTPGAGTTVHLYFPAQAASEAGVPAAREGAPQVAGHVLLVEDNPELALVTAALLQTMGAQVTVARDADAAQAALRTPGTAIDVVFSDIVLGELGPDDKPSGGLALALALRSSMPGLPVILTTGHTTHLEQAQQAGFTVLAKPVAPDVLAAALDGALKAQRSMSGKIL